MNELVRVVLETDGVDKGTIQKFEYTGKWYTQGGELYLEVSWNPHEGYEKLFYLFRKCVEYFPSHSFIEVYKDIDMVNVTTNCGRCNGDYYIRYNIRWYGITDSNGNFCWHKRNEFGIINECN